MTTVASFSNSKPTRPRRQGIGARAAVAIWVVASLVAAPIAPAYASETPPREPTARAEWLSSRAETAFSEGRFSDAIKLYLDAWEAVPSAAILYNVAFIYDRRLEDYDLAVQYYDRAAASPDADTALIEKARARVAAIRAEKNKRPPLRPPAQNPKPQPEPSGESTSWGPILVMGGGGVLLLSGVVMGVVASSTESDFHAATAAAEKRSLQSAGKTEALVADILMVGGLLAAAGGLVWFFAEGSSTEQRVDVTRGLRVEPMFVPGGGGIAIGGGL